MDNLIRKEIPEAAVGNLKKIGAYNPLLLKSRNSSKVFLKRLVTEAPILKETRKIAVQPK